MTIKDLNKLIFLYFFKMLDLTIKKDASEEEKDRIALELLNENFLRQHIKKGIELIFNLDYTTEDDCGKKGCIDVYNPLVEHANSKGFDGLFADRIAKPVYWFSLQNIFRNEPYPNYRCKPQISPSKSNGKHLWNLKDEAKAKYNNGREEFLDECAEKIYTQFADYIMENYRKLVLDEKRSI